MSSKTFYVALYMLTFRIKNNIFSSESLKADFQNIFGNHERLIKLNFVNDLGLIDLMIYRWGDIFFFIFLGYQHLIKNWSQKLQKSLTFILKTHFLKNQYEDFILEDHTYSTKTNSRRLGSVGSALRRIITLLPEKYDTDISKEDPAELDNQSEKTDTLKKDQAELDNQSNTNNFNDLELCLILYDTQEKRQKIVEILSSVTENRKIPQMDLSYYALSDKKQKILKKLNLISEENTSNNEKFNLNKYLKAELKELVEAL